MSDLQVPRTHDDGTGIQHVATSASLSDKMMDTTFLRGIFANPDNPAEARMRDAIDCVCDLVALNPDNAVRWAAAWNRGRATDSQSGSDDFELQALTANSTSVDRWADSSTQHLANLLSHPGSTFAHLGSGPAVARAFADQTPLSPLIDIARQLRSAIHSKLFQTAAREISAERERRLGEAFGVDRHSVVPAMRWQYPRYLRMDIGLLKRYMAGDRSEDIMGIGEWVESDHPAAQKWRPLHKRNMLPPQDDGAVIDV